MRILLCRAVSTELHYVTMNKHFFTLGAQNWPRKLYLG